MRSERWGVAILLAAGLLLGSLCSQVYGQAVNATLVGTVTDVSGAVVPGATIAIREVNTGITRSAETNESGNYVFADLKPGTYQVSAEKQNFKKALRAAVDVVVNSTVRVDLKLEPGAISEIVEVTAEASILQTDRVDTGRKIETRQVEELPLGFNRNFQGLLNLVPGATRAHREHSAFFNAQESLSTEVNGQSRLANNLQFEGVDDNHRTGLLQVYIPPVEAIQTVDVTTSNYDAELGRAGGAVTNVILKSGMNDFHGAAYEINRVSALAALPFFQDIGITPKKPSTYNYYGANIGGPIRKNKTFFFGDFLRINDHQSQFQQATVPPQAFRDGDFSSALKLPTPVPIYDPATGTLDGFNRQPMCIRDSSGNCKPGTLNMIDPRRISPIAKAILAMGPLPNVPGAGLTSSNNFQGATKFIKDTTSFDVKIDHNATQNDRISGRYSFSNQDLLQTPLFGLAGGPANSAFSGSGTQRIWTTAVNYYHIFSSTMITEFRAGVNHYRNVANNTDRGTNASDAIGIRGANLGDLNTSGLVCISVIPNQCLVGYSASLPWVRGETNINVVSNWTKTRSNHTMKWGVDIRRVREDLAQWQAENPRGIFRFSNETTSLNVPRGMTAPPTDNNVNAVASFLLDVPNSVGRDVPIGTQTYREIEFFTYAQDKWQVTQKLTLDFGLRWEFYPPATPKAPGLFSNYEPVTNTLVIAGIGSNPLDLGRKTHYRDFAPRFGIAYRLTEKTVVRGGFGISYAPYPDNKYAWNFPVLQNNVYNAPGTAPKFNQAIRSDGVPASMGSGFLPPVLAEVPANGIINLSDPRNARLLNQEYDVVNLNYREPYVESWNLAVQRSLPGKFVLEVAYVGNHGVAIPTRYNLNAGLKPGDGNNGRPLFRQFNLTGNANLRYVGTSSSYHALQVKFDRKFSGGFLLTTAYTYSKALGFRTDTTTGELAFYINPRRSYAPVEFDRRHTFVQSFIYELPFGKRKPLLTSGVGSWFLGGWQISGILTLMTGRPLVFSASDAQLAAPGNRQTPDINGPVKVLHGIGLNQPWFDTSAFSQPQGRGVFGNMARIAFSGPGFFNLDASLFRRFVLTEGVGLEFRADAFAVTNTPQFRNPGTDLNNKSSFGRVTATDGGNRSVQFGARITF